MAKMKKISDDEKKKFKENARKVIGPATPRPVPGNKEGRASEFYKGSRPMDFLIDTLLPGKPGTVRKSIPGGRVVGPAKPKRPMVPGGR